MVLTAFAAAAAFAAESAAAAVSVAVVVSLPLPPHEVRKNTRHAQSNKPVNRECFIGFEFLKIKK
jgi:hypothetical protein